MDHTPQTPADDRALRLLENSSLEPAHKAALLALVRRAQLDAEKEGQELQSEFGKEHVALIVGCNQFIRLFRSGPQPGAVELLLDAADKTALGNAGFTLHEPEGQVFKLFGWTRIDPTEGKPEELAMAVDRAFLKAHTAKKR